MNIFQSSSMTPANLFTFLFFGLVFFIIIREIITWYWKINRIVELLEKIEQNTSKTIGSHELKTSQSNTQDLPDKNAKTSMLDPRLNVKW